MCNDIGICHCVKKEIPGAISVISNITGTFTKITSLEVHYNGRLQIFSKPFSL